MSCFAKTLATLGVLALVLPAVALAAGEEKAAEVVPCADCHDTVAAQFALSPHARALGRDAADGAVCASCHTGGAAHAEASGDKTLISKPLGAAGTVVCLSCHGGKKSSDIEPKGMHATRGVQCDSCHSIHSAAKHAESLLRSEGSTLCVSCHPAVQGAFRKPYVHPMHESVDGTGKAGMQCASCHNP
ncbi:MAG TPA: cytochrome c3 family protein, partial [Thermoanaerobaculaceae bacterium]|nr:cytochrome c3 family protein [Thermoanaerobaculaceae bacterium]